MRRKQSLLLTALFFLPVPAAFNPSKYRYRLLELAYKASALPAVGRLSVDEQAKLLEQEYGISQAQFYHDRYLTKKSSRNRVIPETRLLAYSHFYNVTEVEIRNDAPAPKRSLAEIVYMAEGRNTGLPLPAQSPVQYNHAA